MSRIGNDVAWIRWPLFAMALLAMVSLTMSLGAPNFASARIAIDLNRRGSLTTWLFRDYLLRRVERPFDHARLDRAVADGRLSRVRTDHDAAAQRTDSTGPRRSRAAVAYSRPRWRGGTACRSQPSFLAFIIAAGINEIDGGWPAVEKALEDATAEQAARLLRKIEYLSVIANIAPMVGLLGTVVGMVLCFHTVASTQGAAGAAQLAEGIYQALITTIAGLIIAIPALGAFAIFRNRVDQLVAEGAYLAQHVFRP